MIKQLTKQVTPIAGVIAGSLAADIVINKVVKDMLNKKIAPVLPVGIGIFLLTMKGDFIKNLGAGMIANAGTQLAKQNIPGLAGLTESDMDAVFEDISEEVEISELDTLNEFDTLNEDISEDISEDFSTLN